MSAQTRLAPSVLPGSDRWPGTARRRGLLILGVAACLVALATGCTPRATDAEQYTSKERIVIRFSHVVAENTPKGLAARRFAALAREKTQGRVEVQVFPNGQLLGDGNEEINGLIAGRVQMIAPSTAKLAEMFPAFQVFDLPYAFPDQAAVVAAMEGDAGRRLFGQLRHQGMAGLAMWDNGWKQMTSSRRPLREPADFRDQRFRVQPGRLLEEQFRLLGATATVIPFDQTFRALQTGQVDGQENTFSNIYSKKFHEVQNYLTVSNHGYLGYVVIANAAFWDGLPADTRAALTEALAETTRWVRDNAARLNAEDLERIRTSGRVEVHVLSPAERQAWMAALSPVYDLFRGVIGPELVDQVKPVSARRSAAPLSPFR